MPIVCTLSPNSHRHYFSIGNPAILVVLRIHTYADITYCSQACPHPSTSKPYIAHPTMFGFVLNQTMLITDRHPSGVMSDPIVCILDNLVSPRHLTAAPLD